MTNKSFKGFIVFERRAIQGNKGIAIKCINVKKSSKEYLSSRCICLDAANSSVKLREKSEPNRLAYTLQHGGINYTIQEKLFDIYLSFNKINL